MKSPLWQIVLLTCVLYICLNVSVTNAQQRRYGSVRNSIGRRKLHKSEPIPSGAASLAFVFDITGSMYDDLVQVIEGAAKILLTTLARREKPLYNYVLVPFHDPAIGPVTVTTDPDQFQDDLRDLYVQGGGDCPEMSISAIKMALEESLPNSFIYVFTDARAKDYHLTEQVLTLIQQKQSQVVFVMTGDCGNTSHPGYKAYEQIASTSSGQVFLLKKSQVNQVLNFVRVAVQSQKVNLMSIDSKYGKSRMYILPVDAKLQDFTISISGSNPIIELRDPTGKRMGRHNGLNELLKIHKALIVNMKNPKPGLWKLKVRSKGPHTMRITGLSSLDFHHGFTQTPTLSLNKTEPRPIKGIPTYALLNATNLDYPGRFSKLELMSLAGKSLMEIPLIYKPGHPALYNVSAFIPPDEFFYLKVSGLDYQGYEFVRTTDTAISPREPTKPAVKMVPVTQGHYDRDVVLRCGVESLVPFVVDWFRGQEKLGLPLFYKNSRNVTWTISAASSAAEGIYSCNATNAAGWSAAQTFLDVKDPPPVIVDPRNISVIPGDNAILTCVAFSTVEFNLTWHRENRVDDLTADRRIKFYTNGSIQIKNVIKKDEGNYICRASNEGGYTEETIFLKIQEAPLASAYPPDQNFVTGETVNISCTAKAFPAPTYVWFRGNNVLPITERVTYVNGHLTIRNATREDAGKYECVATNSAGVGKVEAKLGYIEVPTISVPKSTVLVANGDTAILQCYASGIPSPKIKWYKGNIEMQSFSYIKISDSGEELRILGTQEMDSGGYSCTAENEAGTHQASILLEVGTPPSIVQSPTSQGIDIENNVTLPCQATGKPNPDISWRNPGGKIISLEGRFKQFQSGALFIENLHKSDEGMYTCIAQNQFGVQDASAFITITGIIKPLIAYTNPHLEVIAGRSVRLTCLVLMGKPRPKIIWMKMGERVSESKYVTVDENGNLEITGVLPGHEGEYTCVASNVGGNATYVTRVDVQVPPTIKDGKRDFTAVQGNSIRLPCEVKGDPKPSITWTKNGNRILQTDPHYFINADGSLDIFSADPQDTATYSCTALNIAGVKEARMTLFVQIPPEIAYGPDEFIAIRNNPVQLPCEVSGIPPPTIEWHKDGDELSREHQNLFFLPNGALRINRVQEDDSGIYECVASSLAGNATKFMTVIVQVPPKILSSGPTDVTVMKGDPAMLECETYGDPLPTILWRKDGQTIDLYDPDIKYVIQETGSLLIPSSEVEDTARYVCMVENPAGVVSREINLVVHDPPSISDDTPKNSSVIESQRVVIDCPATGTPRPVITWYKNDIPLSGNEIGVRVTLDGALELDQVQEMDAGKYRCIASNVAGNITHVVDLKVYVPPRFVDEDGSADDPINNDPNPEVVRNKTIKMACVVTAIPPPQITWYKDGQEIRASALTTGRMEILDDGRELMIRHADVDDTARYTCIARNLAGETEKNIDLTVQVPPSIKSTQDVQSNYSVIATRPTVITCPATGVPLPEITWFKDDDLILDTDPNIRILAEGRRLEITNARVEDTGHYKCIAKNPAGTTDLDFDLNVYVPPKIINNRQVAKPEVVIEHTSTLFCPATGVPPPTIVWYKDDQLITQNTSRIFILDGAKILQIRTTDTTDTARYSCRAKNVAGEAEKYFDLNVLVPPSIDETGLNKDPKVVVNRSMVINCPAQGIPTPVIKWLRNDEELDTQTYTNIRILAEGRQIRITSAQVTDTAIYTCRIENKAGRHEVNFNLGVQVPTTIDTKNLDRTPNVLENRTITLHCPAAGIPPPKITWYKDGRPILFEEFPNLKSIWDGTQLTVTEAYVSDTGRYTCRASNPAGDAEISYQLNVWVPPFIDPKKSTKETPSVVVNKTMLIRCEASGVPNPTIEWMRNGRPIDNSVVSRFRFLSNGRQLEIRRSQVADSATYTCRAKNVAGYAERSFDMKVLVPPFIDSERLEKTLKVIKGRPVILHCPATGHPPPVIEWYKERQPVQLGSRVHLLAGSKQLEITNTKEDDTARYTCVASNVAGEAKVDYDLHILVPPSIDESNLVDNPRVVVNRTVLLECPASGIPKPTIQWLKNGDPLESNEITVIMSDGRQLEIDSAQVSDTARYTCIATNEAGELRRNFDLEVLLPPHIDRSDYVGELRVIENRTIYIDCPASGIPPPTIIWMKDSEPLLDFPYPNMRELNNGKQLEIRTAKSSDEAEYTCLASNVAGQRKLIYSLKVLRPPRIEGSREVRNIIVTVGQPVRMECLPVGSPKPEVQWFREGVPLQPEEGANINIIRNGHILQIFDTQIKDASAFSCVAKNTAGEVEKRFNLQVHVPPKIKNSEKMQELSVVIGNSIIIECPVSGIPTPKVHWLRDRDRISFLTNPNLRVLNGGRRLQVVNAQLIDIGGYRCVASNPAGNDSKEFVLNILVPPTIENGRKLVASTVNTRTLLQCEALGLPEPKVTWQKDGKDIPNNSKLYRMHKSGSLEFSMVKVEASGTYKCTAVNEAGATSREIQLIVQVPPSIEHKKPVTRKVTVEQSVTLPCEASGVPRPIITWQKGTRVVSNSQGYRIQDTGSLTISKAKMHDSGIYICIAQNNAGTALGQVRLIVQVPPKIENSKRKSEFMVVKDREVILPCRANGMPPPKVTWEKDGEEIPATSFRYRVLRSGWLVIPVSRSKDTGSYTCIARNDAGEDSAVFDLVVQVPPKIKETTRLRTVNVGESALLECESEGFPFPRITWIKDGRHMIDNGGRYSISPSGSLKISNINAEDTGRYVCTAVNTAGRDSKEMLLRVQIPPTITTPPRDQEVPLNGRIRLECSADGVPLPTITWLINGSIKVYAPPSVNGRSRLIIDNANKRNDGTYMCVAVNPAGERRAVAAVRVKVPPRVLIPRETQAVTLAQRVIIPCNVIGGDPPSSIHWMKNGLPIELSNRIQMMANGSLIIHASHNQDAGEYKCMAMNDAGSSEGTAKLEVRSGPNFLVEPHNKVVVQGSMVMMHCVAEGHPQPRLSWRWDSGTERKQLTSEGRVTILPNNTLRVIPVRLGDSGVYICMARNPLGSVLVQANLTVQVNGGWSDWSSWLPCSVTCGYGMKERTRTCDHPTPTNGGRPCTGYGRESTNCMTQHCPVAGNWGEWSPWSRCTKSCDQGSRTRQRKCNSPAPRYGGATCEGSATLTEPCSVQKCPTDGGWSEWSIWTSCSVSCGAGHQKRYRRCDNPRPADGGDPCRGPETQQQPCHQQDCAGHGNWGEWTSWSLCTLSCGGGTRRRQRRCDSPAPTNGGRYCPGQARQIDYCNTEPCSVHGNWGEWSAWGDCTASCNGGMRRRFRICNNPAPKFNGRPCVGSSLETQSCNRQRCSVDGVWSSWSDWTICTKPCGKGVQQRIRKCRKPNYGGRDCTGDINQIRNCNSKPCPEQEPHSAVGSVIGKINEQEFGISKLVVNVTKTKHGSKLVGRLSNVSKGIGEHLQHLVSILAPVYWSTAKELGKAVNGYTLTQGMFRRDVQVEFTTGEILKMIQLAKGKDANGVLQLDIIVKGMAPPLPPRAHIKIEPYNEEYIQTGEGNIYAHSTRIFRVNGYRLPYSWNHSIVYDSSLGNMPYLVQKLKASDVVVQFNENNKWLDYEISTSIQKGEPSNRCPSGFSLDIEGRNCQDRDECSEHRVCSHSCHNSPGSFSCSCPRGMTLGPDGATCQDVNECERRMVRCGRNERCVNTEGSYRCVAACRRGYRMTAASPHCHDVNECVETPRLCGQHACGNTMGSYRCRCLSGFRQLSPTRCEDINECLEIPGSCQPGWDCHNMEGSYRCIQAKCPRGMERASNNTCVDINECSTGRHRCFYNQMCINKKGGYMCACPRGYRADGPGKPCADINECLKRPCKYRCRNVIGSYECICPPGQKRLPDRKTCAGLVFLPRPLQWNQRDSVKCPHLGKCAFSKVISCPAGFEFNNGHCEDVDECRRPGLCEHSCVNSRGSYRCTCPHGYRLAANGRECRDINECKERRINCGSNSMCFNTRGSYECIHTPCPPLYDRDPSTGFCVLECSKSKHPCPPNTRYADILEFRMIALPSGIPAYQDLIRLIAYDQYGNHLPQTTFTIIENDKKIPFSIRIEKGKGVVYTLAPLQQQSSYTIKVQAQSYANSRHSLRYQTTFLIHISVSRYPY